MNALGPGVAIGAMHATEAHVAAIRAALDLGHVVYVEATTLPRYGPHVAIMATTARYASRVCPRCQASPVPGNTTYCPVCEDEIPLGDPVQELDPLPRSRGVTG